MIRQTRSKKKKKKKVLPVYNPENIKDIPDDRIKFYINEQLFLEALLIELRGTSLSYSCYKKKEREKGGKYLIKT